ncbi:MAG: hypothetical protein JW839_15600 [Candidatus Lokiarchaeota archaeon]|nr:hypothetical protein [Candidatus Lokiarchaeota archaeon]
MQAFDITCKGSLIHVGDDDETEEFKFRLFDSLGDSYFVNDSYFTIGVGITVGNRELESIRFRYVLLNVSRGSRFDFLVGDYIKKSAFSIIAWRQSDPEGMQALFNRIAQVRHWAGGTVVGIAVLVDDGIENTPVVVDSIERSEGVPCVVDRTYAGFLNNLLLGAIRPEPCIPLLSVHSLDELRAPRPRWRGSRRREPASTFLRDLLLAAGFEFVTNEVIIMEMERWAFKIDLHDATVTIAHRYCMGCVAFPDCRDCFKRLCIVQAAPTGFSRGQPGLQHDDLFYLSLIYSIAFDQLPDAVLDQFPKREMCWKARFD